MTIPTFVYAVVIVAWVLLLAPSVAYLSSGWVCRRDRLWDFLTGETLRAYYGLFDPARKFKDDRECVSHFRTRFEERYGRRHYVFPTTLLALTSALALWAIAESVIHLMAETPRVVRLEPTTLSAILGGYVWVVWDQLARFRSRDFTIHDVYGCSFRLLISVPLGLSLAQVLKDQAGPPVAFMLGAFPTQAIFRIIRRRAGQSLGLDETSTEGGPTELVKLQGISRAAAERFQEEGITTIAQLAWTEPVDLTIRTNFDFDYVVDCQSQSLLWVYFEENTRKLTPFGLRGAMEAAEMFGAPVDGGPKIENAPHVTLKAAADTLGMDVKVFGETLLEVVRDPYTQILCSIWYPKWLS